MTLLEALNNSACINLNVTNNDGSAISLKFKHRYGKISLENYLLYIRIEKNITFISLLRDLWMLPKDDRCDIGWRFFFAF